jgi:DNA replication protein DnaC
VPLDHPDFGRAIPCACVANEQEQQRAARLQRYSNLGPLTRLTFANLLPRGRSADPQNQERFARAVAAAQRFAEAPDGWLVLYGGSGSGKTHLAAAVANRCIERGEPALFVVVPDLLDHLRSAYGPDSDVPYDQLFLHIRNAPLLILDDLDAYSATPWAQEKFFQLVNHRFNFRMPTVFTTALSPDQLDDRLATRLLDVTLSDIHQLEARTPPPYEQIGGMARERLTGMTFDNFDPKGLGLVGEARRNLEHAAGLARRYAAEPEGWIVFIGTSGCGKTHLAAAIANERLAQGQSVFFAIVPDLLDHLRSTFSPDSRTSYDEVFDRIRNAPLLVLDDLGAHSSTPWAQEKLYQIINYRHINRLPTVVTTNLQLEDFDPRLVSRLGDRQLSVVFNIQAPDYRIDRPDAGPRRPPPRRR